MDLSLWGLRQQPKADGADCSAPSVPFGTVAALGSLPSVALSSAAADGYYLDGSINAAVFAGGDKAVNPSVDLWRLHKKPRPKKIRL